MKAVIQSGGKGARLRPYTMVLPKPLMPVQGKPVLELLLTWLRRNGAGEAFITTGYLGHLIQAVCGDGRRWAMQIHYTEEVEPLGTVGALDLLRGKLDDTFLMVNGDVLTDLNLHAFLAFHRQHGGLLTVATARRQIQIDFGILEETNARVTRFKEKPILTHIVSTGIYCMEPEIIDLIPPGVSFGFDNLMHSMLNRGLPVRTFLHNGLWLDIGRVEDFHKAQELAWDDGAPAFEQSSVTFDAAAVAERPSSGAAQSANLSSEAQDSSMLLVGEPNLGEGEKAALREVVDSGWITMGERVRAFEKSFAEAHNVADAAAVSSCTAGLHLALAALGIGSGDEVLVPSLSFVATANCALYVGAKPVFVDIESIDEPLMSLTDAEMKCTPRTKAVIVMHYAGTVGDQASWRRFCAAHQLRLVEDAAHAAGASGAGSFGDAAVFSFYGNKNMTTAEGGMVLASDGDVLERVKRLRGHGMTSATLQRLSERTPGYDVTMLGWNYRMDEFRAAIGLVQLRSLHDWNRQRASLAERYRAAIAARCPEVAVAFPAGQRSSVHHFLPVLLPADVNRELVMGCMRDGGVQTTVHYPPIHRLSFYRRLAPGTVLPNTEEFARRELTLPLHPRMSDDDVEIAVDALGSAIRLARAQMR